MKKILFIISILFFSCSNPKAEEKKRVQDSIDKIAARYNTDNDAYQQFHALDVLENTNDAEAKMILKFGQKESDWFFEKQAEQEKLFKEADSINQAKLDSIKRLKKKK